MNVVASTNAQVPTQPMAPMFTSTEQHTPIAMIVLDQHPLELIRLVAQPIHVGQAKHHRLLCLMELS